MNRTHFVYLYGTQQVLTFEEPSRMTYTVVKGGLPMSNHLGEVLMAEGEEEGTTLVTWRCRFTSPWGLGWLNRMIVESFFTSTLHKLVKEVEKPKEKSEE